MRLRDVLLSPLHVAALATGASSFRDNPVIGSPAFNRRGLHVGRAALAERMADRRRRSLARLVSPEHREAFAEQGFVRIPNALPEDAFAALLKEVAETRFPATEMRQGNAVTRFITMSPGALRRTPALRGFLRGPLFQGLIRYVASANADPIMNLHTVFTRPEVGRPDPQTTLHADTFHATAKAWLFLHDVAEEDGPFAYVPGSHRLTKERLEWEREASIEAARHPNGHHALGSFRATPPEVAAMGYPRAVSFAVPANTLVVADTHGFHARRRSLRPSTRIAVYGSLRTNPFPPFAAPSPFDLPGLQGRRAQFVDLQRAIASRLTGRPSSQPFVGMKTAAEPPEGWALTEPS